MERCDDCGFVWDLVASAELPNRIIEAGAGFRRLLLPPDRPAGWHERLATRPAPDVWSPLEYACHVRDVVLVQRDRLYRGLVEDQPDFPPMWREERVGLAAYGREDPGEVVAQLEMVANLTGRAFAVLETSVLERRCIYNYPSPSVRTLRWLGAQIVHEMEHHTRDIAAALAPHEQRLDQVRRSPRGSGRLEMIVRRPNVDERELLEAGELDPSVGLVGDSWDRRSSARTPDRSPHPDMQLTLMNARAADLITGGRDRWALAGDQLYVDLDLSEDHLPPGTQLALGTAVVEITAQPHRGCKKFSARFGLDALRLVNSREGRELRLRGVNARVVTAGSVRLGDTIVVTRP